MVAEDFLQDRQVRQWLDGVEPAWTLLTFDSSRACSGEATICCFARELVNRDDKDGRPPDDADLVVRALAFLEGFAAYPVGAYPTADSGCEVSTSSRHLGSCPPHRERRATWAARPGAVRAHQGPYIGPVAQRTGGHAIGLSPTKTEPCQA